MGILNRPKSGVSRRRFFALGTLVLVAGGTIARWWPSKQVRTTRMLTHDGKLVEVDLDKIPHKMKKVKKNEIMNWIWKHKS